ncbi:class I SAM-dependent methyltransferase [Enterovibrio coralii]|uniref:Methyltransferase domain-containing protein n=1 Tax=Enterovibrio coralii TaxID=294935 RepID=A0A135ICI6_9GAMM|nr:class I SAM-dependent methyltransferase [Enterovibrio coralii]KXF83054.1 hypothetical protein ATN88_04800 [Enterovibrio coralii]
MKDPQTKSIAQSYDDYFEFGLYDTRYPRANKRVLKLISQLINKHNVTNVLDFGCGNGRYLAPLLNKTSSTFMGFDISKVALAKASALQVIHPKRLKLFNKHDALQQHIVKEGAPALTMLLFGVLGHIKVEQQRISLLKWLNRNMAENGRILISVPNRNRRFFCHQLSNTSNKSDIEYERNYLGKKIPLYYHLFSKQELKKHLEMAGFEVERVVAESMLPESWVIHSPSLSLLDEILCQILPASFGYGLIAIAGRAK